MVKVTPRRGLGDSGAQNVRGSWDIEKWFIYLIIGSSFEGIIQHLPRQYGSFTSEDDSNVVTNTLLH